MLKDLPVRISTNGDDTIVKAYLHELEAVQTSEALREFCTRWRALFELGKKAKFRDRITAKNYKTILNGGFDGVRTLKCLKLLQKKEPCGHGPKGSCTGMHLRLPVVLMDAFMIAREYGVSVDIALLQKYGTDEDRDALFF